MGRPDEWLGIHIAALPASVEATRVALDRVGLYTVSTVKLVADHPVRGALETYETRIVGSGALVGFSWSYSDEDEARVGHARAVSRCRPRPGGPRL